VFIMQAANRTAPSVLEIITGAELPELDAASTQIGDPLGLLTSGSLGPGRGIGIGNKPGDGVGPGDSANGAPGKGGVGNEIGSLKKLTRKPVIIYQVEPEYSEPARKAHLQGSVKLRIDVGIDGRPINIRVIEALGMGLDEAAIDAVKRWRFQPALSGSQPVIAPAVVEVGFHLL
jgi:TonB family protein